MQRAEAITLGVIAFELFRTDDATWDNLTSKQRQTWVTRAMQFAAACNPDMKFSLDVQENAA